MSEATPTEREAKGIWQRHGATIIVGGVPTGVILALATAFRSEIPSGDVISDIRTSVVALQGEVRSATKELTRAVTIIDRISANGHPTRDEFNAQNHIISRLEQRVQSLSEQVNQAAGRISVLERK